MDEGAAVPLAIRQCAVRRRRRAGGPFGSFFLEEGGLSGFEPVTLPEWLSGIRFVLQAARPNPFGLEAGQAVHRRIRGIVNTASWPTCRQAHGSVVLA